MKNTGKRIQRKIIGTIALLAAGSCLGLLLLLAVYCLPTAPMEEHIAQSLPMLREEFDDSLIITGYDASLTSTFTDCLMLENAIYSSQEHTLLEQVLYMYRGESGTGDGWAPGLSLVDYIEGVPQPREVEYSRYWHGYLVFLKPALWLTSFNTLRVLASILQLLCVAGITALCAKRGESFLGMGFAASVPFLYFFSMYFSLSLSLCFYVMSAVLLIQLIYHEKLNARDWYCELFLLTGMATAYFDFLTYPLVTLGFPLCVCLYLNREGWKRSLGKLAGYSLEWGVGYLGLWASKWVLTDLLAGGSTIPDAVNTLLVRTDTAENHSKLSGFLYVLKQNLSAYRNWAFALLLLGILLWLLLRAARNYRTVLCREQLLAGGVILLAALFPFAWFFATQNHSEQHWMFTCKILAVSVFAAICGVGRACVPEGPTTEGGGAHGKNK